MSGYQNLPPEIQLTILQILPSEIISNLYFSLPRASPDAIYIAQETANGKLFKEERDKLEFLDRAIPVSDPLIINVLLALLNKSANDLLLIGAEEGYFNIIKFAIKKGADNLNEALEVAAFFNLVGVADYLIEKGADDLNAALKVAAITGALEMVEKLIDYGADDLNSALKSASDSHNEDVEDFLISLGAQ